MNYNLDDVLKECEHNMRNKIVDYKLSIKTFKSDESTDAFRIKYLKYKSKYLKMKSITHQ